MARPSKNTVDYFPHDCTHGKTLFIIEQRYGNDGYAFWFKLLENLGSVEGHYLDMNDPVHNEFLRSKTRCEDGFIDEICSLLAKLGAIDTELWGNKIIWSQNFVDRVSDVYTKNRHKQPPEKPKFIKKEPETPREYNNYADKPTVNNETTQESTQSKVKESKVKESKVIKDSANTENFVLPSKDEIQNFSNLKLDENIESVSQQLYRENIFPEVFAFKNSMIKNKKSKRALLHTLGRCYLVKPEDQWGYCEQIMKVENGNFNEQEYRKDH